MGGAYGLGDDFGEHEDQHGGDGADKSEEFAAEYYGGLAADSCRAYGVGYRVQREYCRQGPGGVALVAAHSDGGLVALLLTQGHIGDRDAHQAGLKYGAEEGYRNGSEEEEYE